MARQAPKQIRIEGAIAFVPLSSGRFAIIDADDVGLIKTRNWYAAKVGRGGHIYAVSYFKRNGKDSSIRMHRVILNAPDGADVDHANGNTLDNRRSNIRVCDRTQNLANKGVRSDSSTGIKGVFLHPNGKYRAKLRYNGKQIHLGYFLTATQASDAYEKEAIKRFGQFARRA